MTDPAVIEPADDTGSKTFDRFTYQAQVAFPYCLDCALGGQVRSVVLEHIEDVAIQFEGEWRFIQVKTRDAELGPWKLEHILAKSGGIPSLVRSFKQLKDTTARFQLHLEGAAKRDDPLDAWVRGAHTTTVERAIESSLTLSPSDCAHFMSRADVHVSRLRRESIRPHNLLLMAERARHLSVQDLEKIYDEVVGAIFKAMQARLLPNSWRSNMIAGRSLRGPIKERFENKSIQAETLASFVKPLDKASRPLLRRIVDIPGARPSLLEQKMIAGGAPQELIDMAIQLRANATRFQLERAARSAATSDHLEDVRMRLQARMAGLVAQHNNGARPAATIFNQLFALLGQQSSLIDTHSLFGQDPDLLVGAVCELSDMCKANWGFVDA